MNELEIFNEDLDYNEDVFTGDEWLEFC